MWLLKSLIVTRREPRAQNTDSAQVCGFLSFWCDKRKMSISFGRVLICDPVDEACTQILRSHGLFVMTKYKLSESELIGELADYDALVVRSETRVTAKVINSAPNLRIIGRAGAGVDNIDVEAATRKGILVINSPGGNTISACELTCAMILALSRNLVPADHSMKEGRWDRKLYRGHELSEKILGIIGFGRIGQEVAHRMRAFDMSIIAFDPLLTVEKAASFGASKVSLADIWKLSDYITVHVPLLPQTKNLISNSALNQCKKGVFIINVARGGIIDEAAILESIKSGHCSGAALDVFTEEPPKNPVTWELINDPRVIATPHLGASTSEAQARVASEIAKQFLAVSGRSPDYQITGMVNVPENFGTCCSRSSIWSKLAEEIGRIAGKLTSNISETSLEIFMNVIDTPTKPVVEAYVELGFLTGHLGTTMELNFVNARHIARDVGLATRVISDTDRINEKTLRVRYGSITVEGSAARGVSTLTSINEALFSGGVLLDKNLSIYRTKSPEDAISILSAHIASNVTISTLSITEGWVAIRTDQSQSITVEGIDGI